MHMHLLAGKRVEAARRDVLCMSIAPCEVETLPSRMLLKKDELVTEVITAELGVGSIVDGVEELGVLSVATEPGRRVSMCSIVLVKSS